MKRSSSAVFVSLTGFMSPAIGGGAMAARPMELRETLPYAGTNRGSLEAALLELGGEDTEYLISKASQYDLVNFTKKQIVENVTYARKVHEALPYLVNKLDDEMWRKWVLPHRVLEEDLCLWRKEFHERMQPVIEGKTSVWEVVVAIHEWLMIGRDGKPPRVVFGPSETRYKTPIQMLEIGSGSWGELNMMMVFLLGGAGLAGESTIQFSGAPGSVNRPVLHSVTDGETLLWGLQGPTPESGRVELKPAASGECLRWASYKGS